MRRQYFEKCLHNVYAAAAFRMQIIKERMRKSMNFGTDFASQVLLHINYFKLAKEFPVLLRCLKLVP